MSNSSLVTYTKISPSKNSPRNHKIDTITIHCIVGQWTAKQGCDFFATAGYAPNYVVGLDGSIGLSVDEKDRSWCTSSKSNDNRAITIEVASDTFHPYKVTDAAYEALIKLCADICKRNGIEELKWRGDKKLIGQVDKQNMTVHRWFANKSCPGEYLYSHHGDIAKRVNEILGPVKTPAPTVEEDLKIGETIKLIEGATYVSGAKIPSWITDKEIYVRVLKDNGDVIFSIQRRGAVTGVIHRDQIVPKEPVPYEPKIVRVTAGVLNIRKGPGYENEVVGVIRNRGSYTIVEEKDGWGKLKSGAGWILLEYTKEV